MLSSFISSTSRLSRRLLAAQRNFTPQEVLVRLRQELDDPRTAAIHAAAARSGLWSSLLPDKVAYDLGRTGNRLPTIVYWYSQGMSAAEIGRRLSLFGGAWDAEHALGVAAKLIAQLLNCPEIAEMPA
jgi:hypothetical protein